MQGDDLGGEYEVINLLSQNVFLVTSKFYVIAKIRRKMTVLQNVINIAPIDVGLIGVAVSSCSVLHSMQPCRPRVVGVVSTLIVLQLTDGGVIKMPFWIFLKRLFWLLPVKLTRIPCHFLFLWKKV